VARHACTLLDMFELDVQQCLLVRSGVEKKDITHIVSQEPALRQCPQYIRREFPAAIIQTYDDTAHAAADLGSGVLPRTAAVVASKACAELYGLALLEEGIQDLAHNYTTFIALEKA
jgi:prephenate dehydratase